MAPGDGKEAAVVLGRYLLYDVIGTGGMATVHLGRLNAAGGFSRIVAIKRLHRHLAGNADFVRMFLDEARLAARLQHPNIVSTLDVIAERDELFLVLDYVRGASVARLLKAQRDAGARSDPAIVAAILVGVLRGLQAAHDAKGETGAPLALVHRDVSPQNVIVGSDGIPRVLDFGVAKAVGREQASTDGQVKGKAGYMSPEQVRGVVLDRRSDLFSAGIVMWELLVGQRLFSGDNPAATMALSLFKTIARPSELAPHVPASLDDVVLKALERDRDHRYASADEMAAAIERAVRPAGARDVAAWVEAGATDLLAEQTHIISRIETGHGLTSADAVTAPAERTETALEPATDFSAISNASRTMAHWRARGIALGVTVAILGGVAWGMSRTRGNAAPATSGASTTSDAPASVAPVSSATSPALVTPDPSPNPAASSGADRPPSRAPARGPGRGAPARSAQCTPPFTVDSSGIRRAKRECF